MRHVDPMDREIMRLALPAMGALAAEPLYVLADTAIVGHLGTPQLGGLAVATTLILSGYAMFIFLAYGTTGTVARLLGAGHADRAAAQGIQAMWLAVGIGAGLAIVGLVAGSPLVHAMGASGEVADHARTYFRISMAGVPSLTLVLAGTGYLRGLQDTKTPLLVALGSAIGNLVLELLFVYRLDLGVAGSAWATVIAQTAAAAVYVVVVARHVAGTGVPVRPDRHVLASLGRVSVDLFVRTAALRAALVAVTAAATRLGTVDVAAHDIAFEIWNFVALMLDCLAIAAQAMIGRCLGAGDAEGARAAGRRLLQWGLVAGVLFAVVLLGLRTVLPDIFTDDPQVAHLAAFLLVFVAVLQPLSSVVWVLDGVLISAGDLRFLAYAMVAVALVLGAGVTLVLALDLGIGWLWASLAAMQIGRFVGLYGRWRTTAWQRLGAELRVRPVLE
jgi:putative MATE family efflux protein